MIGSPEGKSVVAERWHRGWEGYQNVLVKNVLFVIWVLLTQTYSLCGNSLSCTLVICALFYLCAIKMLQKKGSGKAGIFWNAEYIPIESRRTVSSILGLVDILNKIGIFNWLFSEDYSILIHKNTSSVLSHLARPA